MTAQPIDAPRGSEDVAREIGMAVVLASSLGVDPFAGRFLRRLIAAYPGHVSRHIPNRSVKLAQVAVCMLRAAINDLGGPPSAIATIPGVGYCLTQDGHQWLSRVYGGIK